jgi:thiol-disulfide isomerase/thioredoxin
VSERRARGVRGVPAVLGLAALLALGACTSSAGTDADADDTPAARTTTKTATETTSDARVAGSDQCPRLEHAEPRTDGLPDLELPCLGKGPAVRLSDLRGVPTVLNVWAAWCPNCDREMPLFADAERRAGDEVRFFGIHYKATRAQGLQSEDDFGVPFPSVHDEDGDLTTKALRPLLGPPQTFFVTADGRVAGREAGEITSGRQLDRLVKRYLGVDL